MKKGLFTLYMVKPDASGGPTGYLFSAKALGFYALRTETWEKDGTLLTVCHPHVSVTIHGARGASQQLPYPPGWWRDHTTIEENVKVYM